MEEQASSKSAASRHELLTIELSTAWDWNLVIDGPLQQSLEAALAHSIPTRRWFGAKTRALRRLEVADSLAFGRNARLLLVEIEYVEGPRETYQIHLALSRRERAIDDARAWARVNLPDGETALLVDPLEDLDFCRALLAFFDEQGTLPAALGEVVAWQSGEYIALRAARADALAPKLIASEQSNSSVVFGDRLILKIFRRVEKGLNPDLEVTSFLTRHGYQHVAAVAGAIEYRRAGQDPWTLGVMQGFVPNRGDAWRATLAALEEFLRHSIANGLRPPDSLLTAGHGFAEATIPPVVRSMFDAFLPAAELLAKRTAELHLALASDRDDAAFSPEPFTSDDQQAYCQRASELTNETLRWLAERLPLLAGDTAVRAGKLLAGKAVIDERLREAAHFGVTAAKIRCHGDYHLGQVLVTDDDFVIIDFEGEPARSLEERRQKQLALRDVAGMIRSFHYCSCSAVQNLKQDIPSIAADVDALAKAWYYWTSVAFLVTYRQTAGDAPFVPRSGIEFAQLLDICLLEKAIYELRYELNNRPAWVYLPLAALEELVGTGS